MYFYGIVMAPYFSRFLQQDGVWESLMSLRVKHGAHKEQRSYKGQRGPWESGKHSSLAYMYRVC